MASADVLLRVGIDLDNTLADYAAPLERLCREHGVAVGQGGDPKLALRGFLRAAGREDEWTRLQGELYGPLMMEARPFPGIAEFLAAAERNGVSCFVVSHRTRNPIAGQPHDLHAAARGWLASHGFGSLPVHLEENKSAKLGRIASLGVGLFVDDLPELLLDPGFPSGVRRFLFDPKGGHSGFEGVVRVDSWEAMRQAVFP
jgi:hypothetical protein